MDLRAKIIVFALVAPGGESLVMMGAKEQESWLWKQEHPRRFGWIEKIMLQKNIYFGMGNHNKTRKYLL